MKRIDSVILMFLGFSVALGAGAAPATTQPQHVVRVAALGALQDGGFWDAMVQRFEQTTGIHVEPASSGAKDRIPDLFRAGRCDVVVLPAGDAIINLVADGYAIDPQPWLRTDLVLVGPDADPAGVKGSADLATALKKIAQAKAAFINHASSGADETVRSVLEANNLELDPQQTTTLIDDHQRRVFQYAVDKNAYTLISRVPFKSGKLLRGNRALMVENDPHLCRAVMVAIANPAQFTQAHVNEATQFESFLRADATQAFVGRFGKGTIDDRPLFFPLKTTAAASQPATQPARAMLSIVGDLSRPLFLDADAWQQMPRQTITTQLQGREVRYEGVYVRDLLKAAGIPLADGQMNRANVSLLVRIKATDGYQAVFSVPDFDSDLAERSIMLADKQDGQALDKREGPLKLIVPQEKRPVRWVRQVESIQVQRSE